MLPLKSSHKEQPSVICLLWQKDLAQMPFSLRCVQYMVTSILQVQQYMFGVKSLLLVKKLLLMRKNLVAVLFWWPMQRSQRSIPSCGQTGMWWDKRSHEFGRYVEKWNLNVWHLKMFGCWTCSLFSFNSQCCSTLVSCKRKLLGKILHWLTAF